MIKIFKKVNNPEVWKILIDGGIGILPTDTIYGLVSSALAEKTVRRIYKLRKRNFRKPMIILISSLNDLSIFGIKVNKKLKKILLRFWPGKVSIILPCPSKKFFYLHRGVKTLAFRFPKNKNLIKLLKKTGPLVAPSANFEGSPPAKDIKEAKKYFGGQVDFYVDKGKMVSLPSTLISIKNNKVSILRAGATRII